MASFTLIRYRLEDAEEQVEAAEHPQAANEVQHNLESQQQQQQQQPQNGSSAGNVRKSPPMAFARSAPPEPSQDLRSLVSVYQVKPLRFLVRSPPVRKTSPEAPPNAANDAAVLRTLQSMIKTLTRCHVVVMTMSNVGFLLAVLGTITYFWTSLPVALGTFASVCLGVSFVAGVYAVM
ncbi:hypothetical protein BD414DRAFT_495095 [Trametes punicea]|nr:hypothetical protein BD414DRAFT_495095 [Trametes punicea]